jgi:hypothetical protein
MCADAVASEDGSVPPRPNPGSRTILVAGVYASDPSLSDRWVGHPGPHPTRWQQIGADETIEGLEFEWISRADHDAVVRRLEEKIAVLAMQKDYWWHKSLDQAG